MNFSKEDILYICDILHGAHDKIVEIYNCEEKWNLVEKVEETKTGMYVSPLTAADTESNRIICNGLKNKFNYPIVSEENEQHRNDLVPAARTWIVDPIDGTKQFVKKTGDFTTNIGLVENQKPILGFVGIPLKNIVYVGVIGDGIYKHTRECGLERIQIPHTIQYKCDKYAQLDSIHADENVKVRLVCSLSHCNQDTEEHLRRYSNYETKQTGSSLKFIMLALGDADVYPRLGPTSEWDTCAAHAILLAAGGTMYRMDVKGNSCILSDLIYNKKDVLNPYFVAYGPTVKVEMED